jgi:hypothetical protein
MIKRNSFGSKYVDVPTNNIISWGARLAEDNFSLTSRHQRRQGSLRYTDMQLEDQQFPKEKDRV